jgi:hypothetical protein
VLNTGLGPVVQKNKRYRAVAVNEKIVNKSRYFTTAIAVVVQRQFWIILLRKWIENIEKFQILIQVELEMFINFKEQNFFQNFDPTTPFSVVQIHVYFEDLQMHQQNLFFFGYSLLHEHANFPWNCRCWTVFYPSCIVASLNSMVILAEKGACT